MAISTMVATAVAVFDHWDWDKHWIVIAFTFDFDDLLGCFVDDDLWFLVFLFFCHGGWRQYGSRHLLDYGFRSVG